MCYGILIKICIICGLFTQEGIQGEDIQSVPLQFISFSAVPDLPFAERLLTYRAGSNVNGEERSKVESLHTAVDTCPAESECSFMSNCPTLRRLQPTTHCEVSVNSSPGMTSIRLPGGTCCRHMRSSPNGLSRPVLSVAITNAVFGSSLQGDADFADPDLRPRNKKSGHMVNFVVPPNAEATEKYGGKSPLILLAPRKDNKLNFLPGEAPVHLKDANGGGSFALSPIAATVPMTSQTGPSLFSVSSVNGEKSSQFFFNPTDETATRPSGTVDSGHASSPHVAPFTPVQEVMAQPQQSPPQFPQPSQPTIQQEVIVLPFSPPQSPPQNIQTQPPLQPPPQAQMNPFIPPQNQFLSGPQQPLPQPQMQQPNSFLGQPQPAQYYPAPTNNNNAPQQPQHPMFIPQNPYQQQSVQQVPPQAIPAQQQYGPPPQPTGQQSNYPPQTQPQQLYGPPPGTQQQYVVPPPQQYGAPSVPTQQQYLQPPPPGFNPQPQNNYPEQMPAYPVNPTTFGQQTFVQPVPQQPMQFGPPNMAPNGFLPPQAQPQRMQPPTRASVSPQQPPPPPPQSQSPIPGTSSSNTFCGVSDPGFMGRTGRVLGGRPSAFGAWPWMAVILANRRLRCGATIINDQFLITAAHCVYKNYQYGYYGDLTVKIGLFSMDEIDNGPYGPQEVRIQRAFVHPFFNVTQSSFDLALIQLSSSIVFKPHIKPVCLPSYEHLGETGTVLGWGKRKESDDRANLPMVLQEVNLPVLYPWQCILELRSNQIYEDVGPQFVCAGGKANQDACRGDSGGPLLALSNGQYWEMIGIVSKGYGCGKANMPGIYTNIYYLKDWIETTVTNNWVIFPGQMFGSRERSYGMMQDPVYYR